MCRLRHCIDSLLVFRLKAVNANKLHPNHWFFSNIGSRASRAMAEKHISLPRVFSSGNFNEWLTRFKICAKSNGWDKLHAKIATFLEGEALAVYLELPESKQEKFDDIVAALETNFHPETEHFNMISAFNARVMLPNETPRVFLHELKKMLKSTGIDEAVHEKLILYRFVMGLPPDIAAQIKAMPSVTTADEALHAAQRIMSVKSKDARPDSAALSIGTERSASVTEFEDLKAAVESLTMKVDELLQERPLAETAAVASGRRPPIICFRCGKSGHPARLCRAPTPTSGPSQLSGNRRGRGAARTPIFGRAQQGSTNRL